MNKDKMIRMSKKALLAEHKRIIPELRKAGLTKEAKDQAKELRGLKKR